VLEETIAFAIGIGLMVLEIHLIERILKRKNGAANAPLK
jgi:hypothetical protein